MPAIEDTKLANVPEFTLKGRASPGDGPLENLTAPQIRRMIGLSVSITDFGAKGDYDGSSGTDNTAAIQAAINYLATFGTNARKALRVPMGRFLYSSLSIPPACANLSIIGDGWRASQLVSSKTTAGPCVAIDTTGFSTTGIDWDGGYFDNVTVNMIFRFKRTTVTVLDFDAEITDCRLTKAYYLYETWGRGVTARSNVLSMCRYIHNTEFPAPGDYIEADEWHGKDTTGLRRLIMEASEIHSIGVAAVRNLGYNALNAKLIMRNITSEIGDGLLLGQLGEGSQISDCAVYGATGVVIDLTGGEGYRISNIIGLGTLKEGQTGAATNIVRVRGTHTNPTFADLSLGYCRQHAVLFDTGSVVTGLVMDGLDFINPCLDGGTYVPIMFDGTSASGEVRSPRLRSAATLNSIVRGASAAQAVNVVDATHINGSTPAIGGSGITARSPLIGATGSLRFETIGSGSPEGVITAFTGSRYTDYVGGKLYVKAAGTGNTGWVVAGTQT